MAAEARIDPNSDVPDGKSQCWSITVVNIEIQCLYLGFSYFMCAKFHETHFEYSPEEYREGFMPSKQHY